MPENIDYKFLSDLEGGCNTKGYVPAPEVSKSGVTIATGFDLGQRNEAELRALRINPLLMNKLKPYLGAKGKSAEAILKKSPLMISLIQAKEIDKAVKSSHINQLKLKYNSALGNKKNSLIYLTKLKQLLLLFRFNMASV